MKLGKAITGFPFKKESFCDITEHSILLSCSFCSLDFLKLVIISKEKSQDDHIISSISSKYYQKWTVLMASVYLSAHPVFLDIPLNYTVKENSEDLRVFSYNRK